MRVPDKVFKTRENDEWVDKTTDDYFAGKNVLLLSLPGAFTPIWTKQHLPRLEELYDEIIGKGIDEIYCCLTSLQTETINQLTNFAESNLRDIKYIPSHKKIYSKKLSHQNYGTIPVLSLRTIHIEDPFNSLLKRSFDFIFSLFVLLFLLSWLTPILAILIKTSSKGPVFFYQKRNGYNFSEFNCFKFRSMLINKQANTMQATRNDLRVTAIGKILRKYSIDELPQIYNV